MTGETCRKFGMNSFQPSTFQNLETDAHFEVAARPFPNFGSLEFGKWRAFAETHAYAVATPGVHNPVWIAAAASRGALVREVPPAEEPAESAAKKRQCKRSRRPKEHD